MPITTDIQFGDNLAVTDLGAGKIRVDGRGTAGPPGPAGAAGPGNTFVFTQGSPATTWTVTHNLNCHPSVTVVDSGDSEVIPTLVYNSLNTLTLTFGSATSGKAYLN